MKRYILAGIILFFVVLAIVIFKPIKPQHNSSNNKPGTYEYYYNEKENDEEDSLLPEDLSSILSDNQTVPLDTIPSSKTVLVNRVYLLPSDYIPPNLVVPDVKFSFTYSSDKRKLRKVAADALERLFQAGEKEHIELYGVSGYRSYARQKEIYDKNIATRGQAATDAVSARPGSSEHQTGLTIDVSARSVNFRLDQSFGDTKEGRWLAENAHLYGFIIRYPLGKSEITGYSYEPWHIRFVGKAVATHLYENKLTLEEYYGVEDAVKEETAKNESKPRVDVEDPDSVKYATPKPTVKPKASASPKPTKKPKRPKKTNDKPKKTEKPVQTSTPATDSPTAPPAATPEPTPVPTAAPTDPPAAESAVPTFQDQNASQ
ncbi:MAG: M15 family metallopeptidase [Eubacterium sp.]|nr:M15 family metallopeptidase [Eubacterium sp.]